MLRICFKNIIGYVWYGFFEIFFFFEYVNGKNEKILIKNNIYVYIKIKKKYY